MASVVRTLSSTLRPAPQANACEGSAIYKRTDADTCSSQAQAVSALHFSSTFCMCNSCGGQACIGLSFKHACNSMSCPLLALSVVDVSFHLALAWWLKQVSLVYSQAICRVCCSCHAHTMFNFVATTHPLFPALSDCADLPPPLV